MKRFITALVTFIYTVCIMFGATVSFAEEEKDAAPTEEVAIPTSEYMLIADLGSNLFIYENQATKKIAPEGFAKILTAITVLENCNNINEKTIVKEGTLDGYNYNNRNIGLKYGEEIAIIDLLKAMLVFDAGDCAITLAHSLGCSYDEFIALMNSTAKKAGAKDSHFTHPAGFYDKAQTTTLADLYYITKYALKNETFSQIVSTDHIKILPTNMHTQTRTLFNTNEFLTTYYYLEHYNPDIYGVKSYYKDNECGIIARYDDGRVNLLVLCAKSKMQGAVAYAYDDANHLISKATQNFSPHTVIDDERFMWEAKVPNGKDAKRLLLINEGKIKTMLPVDYNEKNIRIDVEAPDTIYAPVKKGEVLGKAVIYYNETKCGEVNLLAYSDIEKSSLTYAINKTSDFITSTLFRIVLIIIVVLFILYIINKRKKKKNK